MDLDLETFLTTLYVMVDDLFLQHVLPKMPLHGRPTPQLADSEVLCLGLAAQWRSGVPWKSERGFLRYAHKHLRHLFPGLTTQSAFNRRLRNLWGAFLLLEQAVAQELGTPDDFEIFDGVPVPVARGARSFHPGWFADIARRGKGGNDRYFYGMRLLLVLSRSGVAGAWTMASGNVQERWLAELLLSSQAGCPQLLGPHDPVTGQPAIDVPEEWVGPVQSCGQASGKPKMTDTGFVGAEWLRHWAREYHAEVIPKPKGAPRELGEWFSRLRQVVETAFSHLCESFGLKYPGAHTKWGLITRVAAKLAAYNVGIRINRALERPDFAFATLIV
jgi:hypothetical protein